MTIIIPRLSRGACWAVAAFGVLSLVGGCLIVYGGGFHTDRGGAGPDASFVDGPAALVMAFLQLWGAWIAFAAVLAQTRFRDWLYVLSLGLVLVPLMVLAALA
jgi:hypothetical protein